MAGCGQYCQQAGGYGGGEDGQPSEDFVTIDNSGPAVVTDGTVPITLTCVWTQPCKGALLIWADTGSTYLGRSDLLVEPGSAATVLVPLAPGADAVLAAHSEGVSAEVLADYGDPERPPDSITPCVTSAQVLVEAGA